jgi:hypothetical protein
MEKKFTKVFKNVVLKHNAKKTKKIFENVAA